MPIVRIDLLPGRAPEVKQALVDRITAAFGDLCGTKAEALDVIFTEVPRDDWFAGGANLPATVIPFLLRGVNLLGIDSGATLGAAPNCMGAARRDTADGPFGKHGDECSTC